jgi:hypothetical protein
MRKMGFDTKPEKNPKGQRVPVSIFRTLILRLDACINLAIERLSTHPLENFFGFVRWDVDDIGPDRYRERGEP